MVVTVERSEDAELAGRLLAEGFAAVPVMRWIFPDVIDPGRSLTGWFTLAAEVAGRRDEVWVVSEGGEPCGAALWAPPGHDGGFDEGSLERLFEVSAGVGGDAALARMAVVGALMDEHHPNEEHWYLWLTALRPVSQGRGLGGLLLRPVLDVATADRVGCHLESSNPRNVAFYERLGFTVTATFGPDDGPVLRGMWRPPQRDLS